MAFETDPLVSRKAHFRELGRKLAALRDQLGPGFEVHQVGHSPLVRIVSRAGIPSHALLHMVALDQGTRYAPNGPCNATINVGTDICGTRTAYVHGLVNDGSGATMAIVELEQPIDYSGINNVLEIRDDTIAPFTLSTSYDYSTHYARVAETASGGAPGSGIYIANVTSSTDFPEALDWGAARSRILSISLQMGASVPLTDRNRETVTK